jgi:glycine oxidase
MKHFDFLVVGQGLAGTLVTYHLIKEGKSVCVIDPAKPSSSSVAGGLFNPVTGRRFVKSWMIDTLLPSAEKTYKGIEELTGEKLYFPMPILRYISGPEEKAIYEKAIDPETNRYIKAFNSSASGDKFASCEITGGGVVNTSLLISAIREYLKQNDSFIEDTLNYDDLTITPSEISYKDITASEIIFCEGYQGQDNPYFNNMPFNPAKGEMLTVKIPGLNADKILISGGYLVPCGDDLYKVGSTYTWDDLTEKPTRSGLDELSKKVGNFTDLPFEIVSHEAGVRPASIKRRPFLGRHPEHHNLSILNGLGTKGVVLAPYFAEMLCRHLLHDEPLIDEVGIE